MKVKLTPRQKEVLRLICEGYSNYGVAAHLGISDKTIQFHRKCLCEIAGVNNGILLFRWAIENGLVEAPKRNDR